MSFVASFQAFSRRYSLIGYAGVGIFCTICDLAAYNILLRCKVPVWLSATVGYVVGLLVGYVLNATLVFQKQQTTASFIKYSIVSAGGLLITVVVIDFLHTKTHKLSPNAAKFVALFFVFFWNYALTSLWAFR